MLVAIVLHGILIQGELTATRDLVGLGVDTAVKELVRLMRSSMSTMLYSRAGSHGCWVSGLAALVESTLKRNPTMRLGGGQVGQLASPH